jgi:HEPN/RES N-terminal domain 1/RES domain
VRLARDCRAPISGQLPGRFRRQCCASFISVGLAHRRNPEFVCGECFSDEGLQGFCASHAQSKECDFCGATADEPIAAPVDEVIEHIRCCVGGIYDDPASAGLAWDEGYVGTTYLTYEIFQELDLDFPKDKGGRLQDIIEQGMGNDLWCKVDPYGMTHGEQLQFSWEKFCRIIKHERRYFFLQQEKRKSRRPYDDELLGPADVLNTIFSFAETEGAFLTLSAGSRVYRARRQPKGKTYDTAGQLGPPPLEHAIQTNRMSPPGVVMTYAADDAETAVAETADKPGAFAIGTFVTERDALILDLTRLPFPPSVFTELPDTLEHDPRLQLNFLHSISRDISKPIARDNCVHIEYVPTQIVTEYVRTIVRVGGRRVDGIRYHSSRKNAGTALVLFADQRHLILNKSERPTFYKTNGRWLRLIKVNEMVITEKQIGRWAGKHRASLFEDA